MDLLSSIRKSGSRGGVNFSWDDVSTSQHRENYLGHSLMAPVGRWQKNRDLGWYAKADGDNATGDESAEQKRTRERKEEIRRIKEAEEDALARALGLPATDRSGGAGTGANAVGVGELNRVIKETEAGDDEIKEVGQNKGFGDFVAKVQLGEGVQNEMIPENIKGGLVRNGPAEERVREEDPRKSKREERSWSRSRGRSHRHRERHHGRHKHRSRSGDRHRHRPRYEERDERRDRSRSRDRGERRYRSRSPDRRRYERDDREPRRDDGRRSRRSRSPGYRGRR